MSNFNFYYILVFTDLVIFMHNEKQTQKFNLPMTRKNLVFQSCTVFLSQLFVQMEFRAPCVTLDQTCNAILSLNIFYTYIHVFFYVIWNFERYYYNLILCKFKLPFAIYGVFRGGMPVTLVEYVLGFINLKITCASNPF